MGDILKHSQQVSESRQQVSTEVQKAKTDVAVQKGKVEEEIESHASTVIRQKESELEKQRQEALTEARKEARKKTPFGRPKEVKRETKIAISRAVSEAKGKIRKPIREEVERIKNELTQEVESAYKDIDNWQIEQKEQFEKDHVYIEPKPVEVKGFYDPKAGGTGTGILAQYDVPTGWEQVDRKQSPYKGGSITTTVTYKTEPGYVTKEFYDSLSPELKEQLKQRGIANFDWYVSELERGRIQSVSKSFITDPALKAKTYEDVRPLVAPQSALSQYYAGMQGYRDEFGNVIDLYRGHSEAGLTFVNGNLIPLPKDYESGKYILSGGVYWKKSDYDKLPEVGKDAARAGIRVYNAWAKAEIAKAEQQLAKLKVTHIQVGKPQNDEWVSKSEFYRLPLMQQQVLKSAGFNGLNEFIKVQTEILNPFEYEIGHKDYRFPKMEGIDITPVIKVHDIRAALRAGVSEPKYKQAVQSLYLPDQIDEASGVIKVDDLDKIWNEGNVLQKSYIRTAMDNTGMYDWVVPNVIYKKKDWNDLSKADKQKVLTVYEHIEPTIVFNRLKDKIAIWSKSDVPKLLTIDEITKVLSDKTPILASSIKTGIRAAMFEVGLVDQKGKLKTELLDKDELAKKWAELTEKQKTDILENYKTFNQRIAEKIEEPVNNLLSDITEWASNDPNEVKKALKAFTAGIAEVVAGLTVGMSSAGAKAVDRIRSGEIKQSVNEIVQIPIGMGEWALVQVPARIADDVVLGAGMLAGALALGYIAKGAFKGAKFTSRTVKALATGETLSRAVKSGLPEVYRVKVPKGFDRLQTDLERIAKDEAKMKSIFESNLSGNKQKAMVREMLTPESQVLFDKYLEIIDKTSDFKPTSDMIRNIDFSDVSTVPKDAASALKEYLQKYGNEILIRGSYADWVQMKGLKGAPKIVGDIDISIIMKKSKLYPEFMARRISKIINDKSKLKARTKGSSVEVYQQGKWHKLADIHYEEALPKMGYGWKPAKPISIEGIQFEALGEQFLRRGEQLIRPGSGSVRGRISPVKRGKFGFQGTRYWRFKDIDRFHSEAKSVASVLKEKGNSKDAKIITDDLRYIETHPKGKPMPITEDELGALQKDFIELVDELQVQALDRGIDVSVEHPRFPEGSLYRYVSPAGKIVKGVVYTATRDIKPFVRAAKRGYLEAGYLIDESGKRVPAPRAEIFTSPEAAFAHLSDMYAGKIPENAGIVAIRTVASDIGKGKVIEPAFRVEWETTKPGEVQAVVLDELIVPSGKKAYTTKPTGWSMRKNSISEGFTGETIVRHPQTGKEVPILWFATESAKQSGLGAPTMAQLKSMNLLALKASLVDLLYPHLPKKIMFSTSKGVKGRGLIEFYKDTYKWKEGKVTKANSQMNQQSTASRVKSNVDVAKTVDEQNVSLLKEATDNLKDRKFKNDTEYQNALADELNKVTINRSLEIFKNKEVQTAIKKSGISGTDLANTYIVNLYDIMMSLGATGLTASTSGTIQTLSDYNLPTLPSISEFESEITKILSQSTKPSSAIEVSKSEKAIKDSIPQKSIILTNITPEEISTIPQTTPSITEYTVSKLTDTTPSKISITKTTPSTITQRTPTKPSTVIPSPTPSPTPSLTPSPPPSQLPPKPPPKAKPPPPFILGRVVSSFEELTPEQKLASIAWKQGWAYHLIYPPYGRPHVLHSNKPFPGVKVSKGAKSAYRSVAKILGTELPDKVQWDLGIMDIVFVRDKQGKKVRMYYTADVKQATTAQPPKDFPRQMPVKRRRSVGGSKVGIVR